MANKELPSRRDFREAKGYLEDFLASSPCVADGRAAELAEELMGHALAVKILRHNDTLMLRFDLNDDGSLPAAPGGDDGQPLVALTPAPVDPLNDPASPFNPVKQGPGLRPVLADEVRPMSGEGDGEDAQ